jgi:hypothetical protein
MLREMKSLTLLAVALLPLACSLPAAAQDAGYWRAASDEAKTITGDITIQGARLSISFSNFTIAEIRAIKPAEASAAFDADPGTPGAGNLYRLDIPASKKFEHHNTICGSDDTQWMATWASGNNLHVAFFSGQKMPALTLEDLSNSTSLCGNFGYQR